MQLKKKTESRIENNIRWVWDWESSFILTLLHKTASYRHSLVKPFMHTICRAEACIGDEHRGSGLRHVNIRYSAWLEKFPVYRQEYIDRIIATGPFLVYPCLLQAITILYRFLFNYFQQILLSFQFVWNSKPALLPGGALYGPMGISIYSEFNLFGMLGPTVNSCK